MRVNYTASTTATVAKQAPHSTTASIHFEVERSLLLACRGLLLPSLMLNS